MLTWIQVECASRHRLVHKPMLSTKQPQLVRLRTASYAILANTEDRLGSSTHSHRHIMVRVGKGCSLQRHIQMVKLFSGTVKQKIPVVRLHGSEVNFPLHGGNFLLFKAQLTLGFFYLRRSRQVYVSLTLLLVVLLGDIWLLAAADAREDMTTRWLDLLM